MRRTRRWRIPPSRRIWSPAQAAGWTGDFTEAAEYQVHRIAQARGIDQDEVREAIEKSTQAPFLGIFGEPSVNVLKVNLILDGILEE